MTEDREPDQDLVEESLAQMEAAQDDPDHWKREQARLAREYPPADPGHPPTPPDLPQTPLKPSLNAQVRQEVNLDAPGHFEAQEKALLEAFAQADERKLTTAQVMEYGGASHTKRISNLRVKGWMIDIVGTRGHQMIYQLKGRLGPDEVRENWLKQNEIKKAQAERRAEYKTSPDAALAKARLEGVKAGLAAARAAVAKNRCDSEWPGDHVEAIEALDPAEVSEREEV